MSLTQNLPPNSIIVITGPTASGKTNLAIQIAKLLDTEIISADSRQIYRLMDICTAKPSPLELSQVKHHLIDFKNPDEDYSAGKFVEDAQKIIDEMLAKNKIPIICGGTGFYIKALFDGLFEVKNATTDSSIREKYNLIYDQFGIEAIQIELKKIDLLAYEQIEIQNPHRVIRAIEYYKSTNESIVIGQKRTSPNENLQPIYIGIDYPRRLLYDRINQRCEIMWNNGLVKEYKNLLSLRYNKDLNSLNTVGYKEVELYLNSNMTEVQALEEFKKNTRRFAKRQLTWFRKVNDMIWIDHKLEDKGNYVVKNLI